MMMNVLTERTPVMPMQPAPISLVVSRVHAIPDIQETVRQEEQVAQVIKLKSTQELK